MYDGSVSTKGCMKCVTQFENWLAGLSGIGWREDGEGRGRVCGFWGGHRKVKYVMVWEGV